MLCAVTQCECAGCVYQLRCLAIAAWVMMVVVAGADCTRPRLLWCIDHTVQRAGGHASPSPRCHVQRRGHADASHRAFPQTALQRCVRDLPSVALAPQSACPLHHCIGPRSTRMLQLRMLAHTTPLLSSVMQPFALLRALVGAVVASSL